MKKFTFLFLSFSLILAPGMQAQNLIAVQNGGNPAFYTKLDSALVHAQNGDTIFIPGGLYQHAPNIEISKQIHMIGVGHDPDSTAVTFKSHISSTYMRINPGGGGGSLTGVYLEGNLWFNPDASNYTVSRCNIDVYLTSTASNNVFLENVIRNVSCGNAQSNVFYNNFIEGGVSNTGENSVFKNNIFLIGGYLLSGNNQSVTFENNIFLSCCLFSYYFSGTNLIFNNNLFFTNILFPNDQYGFTGTNNITNQDLNSIFINQVGNIFSYTQDYHLQPTCPGKNAGTDGTDIGIYGGSSPWKEGSVPANPHVQHKVISNTTDQNGNLNVNIKVAAQDH